jgi:hypothetical protein
LARRRAEGQPLGAALKSLKQVKAMVGKVSESRQAAAYARALELEKALRAALNAGGPYVRAAATLNETGRLAPPRKGLSRDIIVRNLLRRAEALREK